MKGAFITRRHFMRGTMSLALLPAFGVSVASANHQIGAIDRRTQHRLAVLRHYYGRFRAAEDAYDGTDAARAEWLERYDDLVNAGDAVRESITDETPGKDVALFEAAIWMPPPCERAKTYWAPLTGLSSEFGELARAFFAARAESACGLAEYARGRPDPQPRLTRRLIAVTKALRGARPESSADFMVLRRVIESLNNNDVADVKMIRVALPELRHLDFHNRARSCGSYACDLCDLWLKGRSVS